MLPVALVLGVLIGITLGALGAGGSILAVPVLVHVAGLPVAGATATSLVAVGAAATVAAYGHRRNVRWNVAAWFVTSGAVGALAGTAAGRRISEDALLLGFSALVLIAAQRMLTACPSCTKVGEQRAHEELREPRPRADMLRSTALTLVSGVAVGVLTGLFGVGGGFVIVPALTLALGMTVPAAIGTSLVVVAGNAAVALVLRGPGAVDWPIALGFTVTMLAGSVAGAVLARRLDAQRSLSAFAAVLVVVALANAASVVT